MRRWLGCGLLVAACFHEEQSSSGSEDPTTSGPTTDATSTSTSDPATSSSSSGAETPETSSSEDPSMADASTGPCADEIEMPPLPPGWIGPVALLPHDATEKVQCADGLGDGRSSYLSGVPSSCGCSCTDSAAALCQVSLDTSTSCNLDPVSVSEACTASGTSFADVIVESGECSPQAVVITAVDATEVLACDLPPPMGPCIGVPPGYMGPCIHGGPGECPAEFPTTIETTQVGCGECPTCDTQAYCATVTATSWSEAGCRGSETALIFGQCNLTQKDASISVESPLAAAPCGEIESVETPLRYCCV